MSLALPGQDLLVAAGGAVTGATQYFRGGVAFFAVAGTLGGATTVLQILLPDNATWVTVTGSSLAAAGYASFNLPPCTVRAVTTGGTSSSITATLTRVPAGN
jgi:hypothetical protein